VSDKSSLASSNNLANITKQYGFYNFLKRGSFMDISFQDSRETIKVNDLSKFLADVQTLCDNYEKEIESLKNGVAIDEYVKEIEY
jgi:hypothetical protein